MRPSETRMYDVLQCTQWTIPYSQIYVEGELCCTNNSKAKYYALLQTITCYITRKKDTIYAQF